MDINYQKKQTAWGIRHILSAQIGNKIYESEYHVDTDTEEKPDQYTRAVEVLQEMVSSNRYALRQ